MKIAIVAVGKVKQRGLRAELDDYLGRVRRYGGCDEIELKDGSESDVAERFAKAIPPRAHVVALEVEGQAYGSHDLARLIARSEQTAVPTVAFLIGGAYGLPKAVSAQADVRLSLSPMTLPHRIARLVLAEQIYRAFTINRGEPYSH